MKASVLEATWSDFLRDPKTVTDRLDEVDVVLHRRDGEDPYLLTESRHEASQESMAIISRMLASVLQEGAIQLSGSRPSHRPAPSASTVSAAARRARPSAVDPSSSGRTS